LEQSWQLTLPAQASGTQCSWSIATCCAIVPGLVCAQHGHELMGGSRTQNCELMNKNIIWGVDWRRVGRAGPAKRFGSKTTKPCDLTATVNDAVAQGKFMFLSGEICLTSDR